MYTYWIKLCSSTSFPLPCFDSRQVANLGVAQAADIMTLVEESSYWVFPHISCDQSTGGPASVKRTRTEQKTLHMWLSAPSQVIPKLRFSPAMLSAPPHADHSSALGSSAHPQQTNLRNPWQCCPHLCLAWTYPWPAQKEAYPCTHDGKQHYFSLLFYSRADLVCTAKVKVCR